jgi:transposase-like protein
MTALESRGQRFTKEFKQAIARSVQQGTPIKEVARTHKIRPAAVRAWRDELRDLGAEAFSHNGRRKFTKAFKEAAVRRMEEGTPVKEVGRDCRVNPNILRRWRNELRQLGANAFLAKEPKRFAVIIRLNECEYNRLKALAEAAGARSLSYFARSRLLNETVRPSVHISNRPPAFLDKQPKLRAVLSRFTELEYKGLKELIRTTRARSLSEFARSRLLEETDGVGPRGDEN